MKRITVLMVCSLFLVSACGAVSTSSDGTTQESISTNVPSVQVTESSTKPTNTSSRIFKAEVWADNWFSLYVNGQKVGEDSVPITTERSFNSETFTFTAQYPFDINWVMKDFKENDSGLEYIGTNRQQIGDGGFIAQVTDTVTGKVVAVTDANCKCLVIQKAPLNVECVSANNPLTDCKSTKAEEPVGWNMTGYKVNDWLSAKEYSVQEVGAKEGYFSIKWASTAKLIWSSDLKLDNTVLCKQTVSG